MFSIQLRAASLSNKHPQLLTRWGNRQFGPAHTDEQHSQSLYTKLFQWNLLRLPVYGRRRPDFDKVDRSLVRCRIANTHQLERENMQNEPNITA